MPAIDFDLSSTTARIMPSATKSLGVFQSSAGIVRWGVRRSINNLMGNDAPQVKNPAAIVRIAGVVGQLFRQMNRPAKPNPIPSRVIVPCAKEPWSAARIAHPAESNRRVAAPLYHENFPLTLSKKH